MTGPDLLKAWMGEARHGARTRTLERVGEALGCGKVAVWFWTRGIHAPNPERRRALARLTRGAVPVSSWARAPEAEAA
jgi:hypothetical protein